MMVEGVVKGGVESDREEQNSDSGCFRRKASGESQVGGKGGEGVVGGYAVAQVLNMKKSPYIVKWNRVRKSIPSRMSKLPGWNGNWATSNSSPN